MEVARVTIENDSFKFVFDLPIRDDKRVEVDETYFGLMSDKRSRREYPCAIEPPDDDGPRGYAEIAWGDRDEEHGKWRTTLRNRSVIENANVDVIDHEGGRHSCRIARVKQLCRDAPHQ